MSLREAFEIGGTSFQFSADSRIEFPNGVLKAVFGAEPQSFDSVKHSGLEDQSGVVQPSVLIRRLTFPTAAVERTLQMSEPTDDPVSVQGFTGFFRPKFAGTLQVGDGWLIIDGIVRSGVRTSTPLLIRKRFEPGPVDPHLHPHRDLSYALSLERSLVRRLTLLQSNTAIPRALFELRHLEELTLRYFSDETLPDLFGELPGLKRLTLMDMPLRQLPPSFGRLTALVELDIYSTHLDHLPDAIGNLRALQRVWVSASKLRNVPDCLFHLPALHDINLNWNKLESLPDSVGTNPALRQISLEGNLFTRLPGSLAKVPEVSIDAKFKPLYSKAAYKSRNRKKIRHASFGAATSADLAARLNGEIDKHELHDYRDDLLKVARRAVIFDTTQPDDYSQIGNTRFGGDPDLPRTAQYPMIDNEPLAFLAQIDLAEVVAYQEYLPRTGLLSFFALLVDEEEVAPPVKVFHFPETSDLVRCVLQPVTACGLDPFRGFKARSMPHCSLPFLGDLERQLFPVEQRLSAIENEPDLSSRYRQLHEAMLADRIGPSREGHGINGFVYAQVHTPEQLACEVHGGVPEDWMVLLSLASDDRPGFCFLDGGTLTFCVHKRDLAIAEFAKVVASIESS